MSEQKKEAALCETCLRHCLPPVTGLTPWPGSDLLHPNGRCYRFVRFPKPYVFLPAKESQGGVGLQDLTLAFSSTIKRMVDLVGFV